MPILMRRFTAIGLAALFSTARCQEGFSHFGGADGGACRELSVVLPGKVTYPNSTLYAEENVYWSERQSELHPSCFVTPESATDVSTALTTLVSSRTPFTVKGGGHTAFPGGSSIGGRGVVIDLVRLGRHVVVSPDRRSVEVGAGARWINVSQVLDPLGLAVVGGRVSDVGVAGLTLGGGLSFFSGMYGWACDNVLEYEIVVASGEVLVASPKENPDLYWALRGGGGSNFGIVTKFKLLAFDQGDLWVQSNLFPDAVAEDVVTAIQDLTVHGLPENPKAHTFFAMTYIGAVGGLVAFSNMYHADPQPEGTIPEVFEPFQSLPTVSRTTSNEDVTTLTDGISEPYGRRQSWLDTTFKATDAALFTDIVALFREHVKMLNATASSPNDGRPLIDAFLTFQPVPVNVLRQMQKNGGNALGITPRDGPLMIMQITVKWDDPAYDPLVQSSSRDFITKTERIAKKRELLNGFKYMNYAGEDQRVQESYGFTNLKRLRKVALTYDPKRTLQRLWKGYFQVW